MEDRVGSDPPDRGRRRVLGAALALACFWARPGGTAPAAASPRVLAFRSLHTGEELETVFWRDGGFVPEALRAIDRVLRDHRTGDVRAIDRGLLQLLADLRDALGTTEPFEIISGYRSPATNTLLRQSSSGVARRSLHLQGRAADIRVPGQPLALVRETAVRLRRGGVGYYRASDFVHVDVGRVRVW
jgi:uncharacterized protein YcbK (DUF882 family)